MWNWGDGTLDSTTNTNSASHTYKTTGTHTITLTVTDNYLGTGTATHARQGRQVTRRPAEPAPRTRTGFGALPLPGRRGRRGPGRAWRRSRLRPAGL